MNKNVMHSKISLLVITLCWICTIQAQIFESKWIDVENEKVIAEIVKENEAYFLKIWNQSFQIHGESPDLFIQYSQDKLPIVLDYQNEKMKFVGKDYIAFPCSMKGKFTGVWENKAMGVTFIIRIDGNTDLTWEVMDSFKKKTKFWPKPTEDGFYFTYDRKEYSYVVKDNAMIDNKGRRFTRISELD